MTDFATVYERFLSKVEDTELAKMSLADRTSMLNGWLTSALAYIGADRLKMINDLSTIDTLQKFVADLENPEIEVIAMYMVVAWYDSKVNSLEHTLLFMGSKDEKWTNQKEHLKATKEIQDSYRRGARKYFRNHSSRYNQYINEEESSGGGISLDIATNAEVAAMLDQVFGA